MNRHPTLDEIESGQTIEVAYLNGDTDTLDAIDTDETRNAASICNADAW